MCLVLLMHLVDVVFCARSWSLDPDMTALLDNKARFSAYSTSKGLQVPQHYVVNSPRQLRSLNDFQVRQPTARPLSGPA